MTGSSVPAALAANPFVGPRPLEPGQKIFGRDAEIDQLYYLLSGERMVLLHSPSGAGKSSLLHAGLLPRLSAQFDVWAPVRVSLPPGGTTPPGVNRFARSCILGFEAGIPRELQRPEETIVSLSLADYVAARPRRRSAPRNIVLIFDQFEEVLTVDMLNLDAKRAFFAQLGQFLSDPHVWAIFAIREDYLAPLDPYAGEIPNHLKVRFRLDLLSRTTAAEAMEKTAETAGRTFAPDALNRLVVDLAMMQVQQPDGGFKSEPGPYIEPLQLQVVCRNLWSRMADGRLVIENSDIDAFGSVSAALSEYYASEVHRAAGQEERTERAIREWIARKLIAPGNIRSQILREAGKSGGLGNDLIGRLINTHLVRAEQRAGATWYELSHDRLILPMQENNTAWFQEHLSQLQKSAALWHEQKRPEGLLLLGADLAAARAWARDHLEDLEDEEHEFLKAAEEKQQQNEAKLRSAKKLRRALWAAAILALVACAGLVVATFEGFQARKAVARAIVATIPSTVGLPGGASMSLGYLANAVRNDPQSLGARAWISDLLTRQVWWFPSVVFQTKDELNRDDMTGDGKLVVTGTRSGEIQLWNAGTGAPIGQPVKQGGCVDHVIFSHDGRLIAAVTGSSAQLFDVQTRQPVGKPLQGHTDDINHIEFSRDDRRLLTSSEDATARVWDTATGNEIGAPMKHGKWLTQASFSLDGGMVATASGDKTARIWNAATGQPLGPPLKHDDEVHSAEFSPDGRFLVTSTFKQALVWNVATASQLGPPLTHDRDVNWAEFSHDGKRIVTSSEDQTAKIWDWDPLSGARLAQVFHHESGLYGAEFTGDDREVLTFAYGHRVQVWNAQTGEPVGEPLVHNGMLAEVKCTRDGSRILTAVVGGTAQIWQPEGSGGVRAQFPFPNGARINSIFSNPKGPRVAFVDTGKNLIRVSDVEGHAIGIPIDFDQWLADGIVTDHSRIEDLEIELSDDDTRLALSERLDTTADRNASPYSNLRIFDLKTGQTIGPLIGNVDSFHTGADGATLITVVYGTGSSPDVVRAFDMQTGAALGTFQHSDINRTEVSPNGQMAITSYFGGATVWNARTGAVLYNLKSEHAMSAVEFSPDSKFIAVAARDRSVTIYPAATGVAVTKPMELSGKILGLRFSPDSKSLVTAANNQLIQVWQVATGAQVGASMRLDSPVQNFQFSPDGTTLLVSTATAARIWDPSTGTALGEPVGQASSNDKKSRQFASFSKDGRQVFIVSDKDGLLRGYRIFLGDGGRTDNLLLASLAQVAGGYRMNTSTGALEVIDPAARLKTIKKLREKHHLLPGDEFLSAFVRKLSAPLAAEK